MVLYTIIFLIFVKIV